jgi:hypothetical protein
MSYRLEWVASPNFTPASQVQRYYGRPRTIEFGAGHWWGDPNAGYSHQGVINTFLNPARQASAHAVISEGRVTEMVRSGDVAWATNNANPYTVAIELKPNMTAGDKYTCAEYIADKGWHNLQWKPHKTWWNTGCNPLPWGEIMQMAKDIWNQKHNAPAPTPSPVKADIEWVKLANPLKMVCTKQPTKLWNFNQTAWGGFGNGVKDFNKGDQIDIYGKAINKTLGATYLVTQYSFDKKIANGFNQADLEPYVAPAPVAPEWQRNLVDIEDVKLTVLPAEGTQVVNLNDLSNITPLAKGTVVDIAKKTVVNGKTYLLSAYSVANLLPNGLLADHLGVPAQPPVNEKPEWLENWEDITDKKMYTRVKAPLVNLLDGSTIKEIDINTEVEIASATTWHGQKYMITKYSTDKQEPRGIALVNLDNDPIKDPEAPIPPAPTQPTLEERVSILEKLYTLIKEALKKIGINL